MSILSNHRRHKTVYVIIYLPGYAGHFLEYALTMAWAGYLHDSIPDNMFDMQAHGYQHWSEIHHDNDYDTASRLAVWLLSDSSIMVTSVHPSEFLWDDTFPIALRRDTNKDFKVKYILISLQDGYQYVLNDFKRRNGDFPYIRENEFEFNNSIANSLPVLELKLEYVLSGQPGFLSELKRISRHQNIEFIKSEKLVHFYDTWYSARQLANYVIKPGCIKQL